MGKIAFVFAGQGAQKPGMGQDICNSSAPAAAVFAQADKLRPGTMQQCFSGTEAELKETKNTQPCMFAMELAIAAALADGGLRPDMVAGMSLGELSALCCSGAADFETVFRLVCRRGELMQRDAEKHPASMAAVLKLPNEEVERICAGIPGMYPVNYNCPGQLVVSGPSEKMPELSAAVKAAGGRALPLKVGGGFHSPYMQDASAAFAADLAQVQFSAPVPVLYSNCTGLPYTEDFAGLLAKQISAPVRWEAIVRHMIQSGADTFIEIGPGDTLSKLISKIDSQVRVLAVSDMAGLTSVLAEVNS